jgi:CRP/FNR family transcriptional regulator, nitrogen fixation regulation protein
MLTAYSTIGVAHEERSDACHSAPRSEQLSGTGTVPAVVMSYAADERVFGQGMPRRFVYKVKSGVVRTFTLLGDGRRQIDAFHFPDDVFGLELNDDHSLSAEAVAATQLLVFQRSLIDRAAENNCAMAQELLSLTGRTLERTRAQVVLSRRSAIERLANFLLNLGSRVGTETSVDLPMSRYDIADYLGLTIETVSRMLSELERIDAIVLTTTRHIVFRDRVKLTVLSNPPMG